MEGSNVSRSEYSAITSPMSGSFNWIFGRALPLGVRFDLGTGYANLRHFD